MILKCKFKKCFGIGEMEHTFEYGSNHYQKENVFSVYAKNGLMKTSFTNIFSKIRENKKKEINDKIFGAKETVVQLCKDENCANEWKFDKDSLFVVKSMDSQYKSEFLSNLLVNDDIKKELEDSLKLKEKFFEHLKNKSGLKYNKKEKSNTSVLETKFFQDLKLENDSFFIQIKNIENKLKNELNNFNDIKYDEIFNESVLKKIEEDEFQEKIKNFKDEIKIIYEEYGFLEKGEFSYVQFKNIATELEENHFFTKGNEIKLNGRPPIKNEEELKKLVDEIDKKTKELSIFQNILEPLEKNEKGQKLIKIIEKNTDIVIYLEKEKWSEFKEQLWVSYIKDYDFNKLKKSFESVEKKLNNLKKQLEEEKTKWEIALEIFEERFYTPYKMKIANKFASIIGEGVPAVLFEFKNSTSNEKKEYNQDTLNELDILSQGEKRALYLLNIIFDIEKLKIENKKNAKDLLIIIDDIADSFDYKNKYAIIEYLNEIAEISKFKLIILTHNFDFYRAINLRLSIPNNNQLYATKQDNKIKLEKFQLNSDDKIFFLDWIKKLNNRRFIALIPYVRNIIRFTNKESDKTGQGQIHFNQLSEVLHAKGPIIKCEDIKTIFSNYIHIDETTKNNKKVIKEWEDAKCNVWEKIYSEANGIVNKSNYNLKEELEFKIVLSIAARLKSEKYMIDKLNKKAVVNSNNNNNSSNNYDNYNIPKLLKLCVEQGVIKENDEDWSILKQVSIITPENIHINSFMFEPLIDIEFNNLKDLYMDVIDKLK